MILEIAAIVTGMLVSFFLKDINFLSLNYVYPDFLIIFIIYFALRRNVLSGIWIGFFSGLLEDSAVLVFSHKAGEYLNIMGVHMFFYTLMGYIFGKLNRFIDSNSFLPVGAAVFAAALSVRFSIWLTTGIMSEFNKNFMFILPAIYTALMAPIWFWILGWLYRLPVEEK